MPFFLISNLCFKQINKCEYYLGHSHCFTVLAGDWKYRDDDSV